MKTHLHPPVDAGHGVARTVLADSPEIMLVEFAFAEGGEGLPHSHPHVQSTFVKAGRYRFTVGDETFEVGPGDAFIVPSGVTHGCRALGVPGVLIDSFTPRRDDFL
jgi:quercetin dioxygenase-like cupin family protein